MRAVISLIFLIFAAAIGAGCQSDEAKLDQHLERGASYLEGEQYAEAIIEFKNVLQIDPNSGAAHWGLARAFLKTKRARDGFWELRETARLDPDNLEAKLQFGQIAIYAGELEESLKQAEEVIAADPNRATAYLLKGRALEAMRRPEDAQRIYERALEISPDSAAALLLLAIHHRRHDNREQAEPLYRRLTEVEPSTMSFTALGGFLAREPERVDEAEVAYRQALELAEPEQRVRAIAVLAGLFFSRDRFDDAVRVLDEGIEKEEEPLDLIYLLARFYRAHQENEKADRLIRQATEARPDDPRPQLILSSYLGRKRDLEGALAAARRAVELDPESELARLRTAEVLVESGYRRDERDRIDEGRAIIDEILGEEPSHAGALFVKAKVDLAERDADSAVIALRAAIDARPEWAQAHFVLGTALALQGESSVARAELARSLEIDAGLVEARKMLAKVHLQLREFEYAIDEGRLFLRERPNDVETRVLVAQSLVLMEEPQEALDELEAIPEEDRGTTALYAMGRIHSMLSNLDESRKYLLLALESSPYHAEILGSLMALDRSTDRQQESDERIRAALAGQPDNAKLHRLMGVVHLRLRDGDAAEKSFRRAIELDPTDLDGYNHLAIYYRRSGRTEETIRTYESAIESVPTDARLHHFLGVLYQSSGQEERAMERYEDAIRHDPNLAEAKNNLAYLLAMNEADLDRALDLAQEAKALMPDDPNTADTLGWVLYKRGIASAAITYFREAEARMEPLSASLGVVRQHLAMAYEANGEVPQARAAIERALAGLEDRQQRLRALGAAEEPEPSWVAEVRTMLARLPEVPPSESEKSETRPGEDPAIEG